MVGEITKQEMLELYTTYHIDQSTTIYETPYKELYWLIVIRAQIYTLDTNTSFLPLWYNSVLGCSGTV